MTGVAELAGLVLLALIGLGQGGTMLRLGQLLSEMSALKTLVDHHARVIERLERERAERSNGHERA
ncbi:MAG: hypothetical protein ACFB0Z_06895 [Candidatus Phaeomarinobacter sp.]